jgi:hypothetical protein
MESLTSPPKPKGAEGRGFGEWKGNITGLKVTSHPKDLSLNMMKRGIPPPPTLLQFFILIQREGNVSLSVSPFPSLLLHISSCMYIYLLSGIMNPRLRLSLVSRSQVV